MSKEKEERGMDHGHETEGQDRKAQVRREIAIFLALTGALTAASIAVVVSQGVDMTRLGEASLVGQLALFGQAFYPGVAAIAARLTTAGTLRGLGWGWGSTRRYLALGYALPLAYCAVAYGPVWVSGLAGFDPGRLAAGLPLAGVPEGVAALGAALLALTVGLLPFLVLSLGEEIGWRGLMVPRLAEVMTLPKVALCSGLAWAAFHAPLMLFVPGAIHGVPVPYAVACFAVTGVALSYPLAWLRLKSRSVWPAVVLHASHNAAVYLVCDPLTADAGNTAFFAGETGAGLALVGASVAALWWLHDRRVVLEVPGSSGAGTIPPAVTPSSTADMGE